jgi:hypothetical protein
MASTSLSTTHSPKAESASTPCKHELTGGQRLFTFISVLGWECPSEEDRSNGWSVGQVRTPYRTTNQFVTCAMPSRQCTDRSWPWLGIKRSQPGNSTPSAPELQTPGSYQGWRHVRSQATMGITPHGALRQTRGLCQMCGLAQSRLAFAQGEGTGRGTPG